MIRMSDLKPGDTCVICKIETIGELRKRFLDIGLIENTLVKCQGESPDKNMSSFIVRGTRVAIRKCDINNIFVKKDNRSEYN